MAATTTLLGLVTPTQGTLSGTWGDTVNYGISDYVDISVAGTLTLTNDGAVTLANTTGSSSGNSITSSLTGAGTVTAQFAIVKVTGTLTTAKVVTGPSYSKTYTVVNSATGGIVTFKASGQTGVSIAVGESAFVYFNGTDYVKVSGTVAVASFQTSLGGLTPSTATTGVVTLAGTLNTTSGGTGLTSFTAGDVPYYASGTLLSKLAIGTAGQFLTSTGTAPQWSTLSGVAVTTFSAGTTGFTPSSATSGAVTLAGTLATTNGGTNLTSFTSGGAVYATSTSALTTGTLPIASGGTGQTTANAAFNALVPSQTSQSGKYLTTDGTNTSWGTNPLGTVTSVAATVPSFLSITGSPITTSGTLAISLSGTALPTTSGGTGLTSFTSGGVVYASSSSALATGSALTFDGTNTRLGVGGNPSVTGIDTGVTNLFVVAPNTNTGHAATFIADASGRGILVANQAKTSSFAIGSSAGLITIGTNTSSTSLAFNITGSEQMRLTSTGLGIGTSSPTYKLQVKVATNGNFAVTTPNSGTGARVWVVNDAVSAVQRLELQGNPVVFPLTSGADGMYFDASAGNLGIGTSSPTQRLEVLTGTSTNDAYNPAAAFGTAAGANQGGVIGSRTIAADTTQGLYISSGQTLTLNSSAGIRFQIGALPATAVSTATEYMRLTTTGLGIGTTSPAAKLHVSATTPVIRIDATAAFNATPTSTLSFVGVYNAGGGLDSFAQIAGVKSNATDGDGSGFLRFSTNTSTANLNEKMRITSAGDVGIGITTPATYGSRTNLYVAGSLGGALILGEVAKTFQAVVLGDFNNGQMDVGTATNHPMRFITNNTERVRILSGGNVGIGTSSATTKLDVRGNVFIGTLATGDNVLGFGNTTGTGVLTGAPGSIPGNSFIVGDSADVSGFPGFLKFYTTDSGTVTETMRLTAPGNLLVGGVAARSTTIGSKHLDLFNGTAPAGTLTNGVSLYSSSGDLKFMNAAGDAFDVGYRNIPQNSQSAAYTLVLADAGKHIFHPSTDANARTYTIPANSSVAYPIGTAITFINMTSQVVTIAITTDTMYLSSAGTTGSRSLAQYGSATAIKMTSTTWLISGSGLT